MINFHLPLHSTETLYSWLIRVALHTGYPNVRMALQHLIGSDHKQLASAFVSCLPQIAALSNTSGSVLADRHSILPAFRSFVTDDVYQDAQSCFINGRIEPINTLFSITANRMKLNVPLRYCPICSGDNMKMHGYAYWHIQHQLPGVYVCPEHQTALTEVRVGRRGIVFPGAPGKTLPDTTEQLLKLAKFSSTAWKSPLEHYDGLRYRNCIREKLQGFGYVTEQKRIRQDKWQRSFRGCWEPSAAIEDIAALLKNDAGLYLQALFTSETKLLSPLKHFLLLAHLFESWQSFKDFYSHFDRNARELKHAPQREPLTIRVLRNLPEKHGSLRSFARNHQCSVITAKKLAVQQGVQIDRRPKMLFGAERDLIQQLLKDGLKTAEIACKMLCSVAAVEQILAQNPDIVRLRKEARFDAAQQKHRDTIQSLLMTSPNLRRVDVQRTAKAAYMWLYKHDSAWLYQTLPAETPRTQRWLH